jgi:ankyrin repeat protein
MVQGTALIEAASRGHAAVCKLLISRGSNVDAQNRVGNTALSMAVFKNWGEVVDCLMEAGANAALKDNKRQVRSS